MAKKILIVDDEKIARDRIKRFLKSAHQPLEVYEAENGPQAIQLVRTHNPDLLLLDIQMPEMSGFDVLLQLNTKDFQFIFQTAYDEFAVKAFEVNACDYLLKPFSEERLLQAVEKAFSLQRPQSNIQRLEKHLKYSQVYLKTLLSKNGSSTKVIKVDDISYFKSEDHYTFAVVNGSEFIVDHSISWLEKQLDPNVFTRCHRSHLVKLSEIEKIGPAVNSILSLKDATTLGLSRENRKKLLTLFTQYSKNSIHLK